VGGALLEQSVPIIVVGFGLLAASRWPPRLAVFIVGGADCRVGGDMGIRGALVAALPHGHADVAGRGARRILLRRLQGLHNRGRLAVGLQACGREELERFERSATKVDEAAFGSSGTPRFDNHLDGAAVHDC
jgi:hypothetical protein